MRCVIITIRSPRFVSNSTTVDVEGTKIILKVSKNAIEYAVESFEKIMHFYIE